MVNARHQPARFNVLLTEDRRHADEHWVNQLPRLLEPQGVQAFVARSGREAVDITMSVRIHAAVVDIATPTEGESVSAGTPGGLWLLEMFRRLPDRPPTVVVNNRLITQRQAQRLLADALRLGAFSVVNRPNDLDELLAVFRRLIDRRYRGQWPADGMPGGATPRADGTSGINPSDLRGGDAH